MSILTKYAKYIGFTVIAIIFLAVPALFTLAIVYDWGFFLGFLLAALSAIEIFAIVLIFDRLAEEM